MTLEDGLTLYRSHDLVGIGKMAHAVQQNRSGDAVYFVLNQKIEHTNVCVLSCKFCDFAVRKGEADAYEMTAQEILGRLTPEIKEVHITGGMPADWPWERYLDIVESIHRHLPDADVKAFTAVEIDFFHKKFKMSIEEVLRQLKAAGLRTMPGGGAEIFSERVRKQLFPAEDRRQNLAGSAQNRTPPGYPHQQHHALRAHRNPRRAADPYDQTA